MKARFKVIEIGWGTDLDNDRHPWLRLARLNYSLVLYAHPVRGWEVITLKNTNSKQNQAKPNEIHGKPAADELAKRLSGKLILNQTALYRLAEDLYEFGRQGAAIRRVGKTINLKVEQAK